MPGQTHTHETLCSWHVVKVRHWYHRDNLFVSVFQPVLQDWGRSLRLPGVGPDWGRGQLCFLRLIGAWVTPTWVLGHYSVR